MIIDINSFTAGVIAGVILTFALAFLVRVGNK